MQRRDFIVGLLAGTASFAFMGRAAFAAYAVTKTDAQWKKTLSPGAYDILRQQGTEPPFSSPLDKIYAKGTYACVGCGQVNYSSDTKYDSHTGWPSFWKPLNGAILTANDTSLGMTRTEVHCKTCGGHLGHVFSDGPKPTGLRYCMNGLALKFTPAEKL